MPIRYRVDEGDPYPTGELARKGDGRYLLERELDGVQIHAVVRGGEIAAFEGTREGAAVPVTAIQIRTSGNTHGMLPARSRCCICVPTDYGYICYETDC